MTTKKIMIAWSHVQHLISKKQISDYQKLVLIKCFKHPLCISQTNAEADVISLAYVAVHLCEGVEITTGCSCAHYGVVCPSIALCLGMAC